MQDTPNPNQSDALAPRRTPSSRYYGETRSTASAHPGPIGERRVASTPPTSFERHSSARSFEGRQTRTNSDTRGRRIELLNDVAGREPRVFGNSPFPRASSPASDDGTSSDVPDDTADEVIERVSRFELLNDVAGRELRVFRKSPCPLRARSPASDDGTSDGASDCTDTECSNDAAARELKVSPCLHLEKPYLVDDARG
ncbi:hypothetical protein T484DRAFT_1894598 [Baffinella frigidus]|nr:hypothetical protein T484DRAFT_1894598 [Cryptophyta sp. CCMP2293]